MIRYYLPIFLLSIIAKMSMAQTVPDYAVQLTAQTQQAPTQITLSWKAVTGATGYVIYKKAKTATSWGTAIATATGTSYTDNAVVVDSAYEYKVVAQSTTQGTGYIYAGIKKPAIHNRGSLLLLVDTLFTNSCAVEIKQLMQDISGDGWEVLRKDFPRTETVVNVKAYITGLYQSNANLNAVLILGHIAVPYSGDQNPDGHPDHLGAWPADGFYADMNGIWTDASVNDIGASRPENKNIPGDGKYDQVLLPSPLELQISRIDFANMPLFTQTEVQLMKNYLNRDHQYKTKQLTIIKRSLIDDNFGTMSGEAFAANGWRNFPPLVGKDSVASTLDFITTLNTSNYQWAYGCGGGTYTSASGIGSTSSFTNNNANAIFTMLFGSYFGDWDAQNNFLRAPLCSNTPALTCCWAGRPNWFFHHMALGENIGYSARLSQNNDYNNPLYTPSNYGASFVHTALMGDLTLRMDYVQPATGVTLTSTPAAGAIVSWTASAEPGVIGYYIYRSNSEFGQYEKCSPLVTGITYTDSAGIDGKKFYMVRAAKIQATPSGSYVNLSPGNIDSGNVTYPIDVQQVKHSAMNIALYPNPAKDELNINLETCKAGTSEISISNIDGRELTSNTTTLHDGTNTVSFNVKTLPAGLYILVIRSNDDLYTRKWIKAD